MTHLDTLWSFCSDIDIESRTPSAGVYMLLLGGEIVYVGQSIDVSLRLRYLAVEHVMRFGERLLQFSPETAQRIAVAMMRPFDLVVFPRVQLTAAERARRLEQLVRSMPLGDQLVARALETP